MDDFTDPVLPDSAPPEHGKNIDPATEAELAFDGWSTRTDELIKAADVWLDEVKEIETDDHANKCDSFLTQMEGHWKTVEAGRVAERKPHLDANTKIQSRYKAVQGRLETAKELLLKNLRPFQRRKEAEKAEAERAARAAAQEEQRKANEAARLAAESETVDAVVKAEAAQKAATQKSAEAGRIARSSAGIKGDYSKRARTIRKVWTAEITDIEAAFQHYKGREEVIEVLTRLGAQDARAVGEEITIPGFKVFQKETG